MTTDAPYASRCYAKRKEAGECTRCGKADAGAACCAECRAKINAQRRRPVEGDSV